MGFLHLLHLYLRAQADTINHHMKATKTGLCAAVTTKAREHRRQTATTGAHGDPNASKTAQRRGCFK